MVFDLYFEINGRRRLGGSAMPEKTPEILTQDVASDVDWVVGGLQFDISFLRHGRVSS